MKQSPYRLCLFSTVDVTWSRFSKIDSDVEPITECLAKNREHQGGVESGAAEPFRVVDDQCARITGSIPQRCIEACGAAGHDHQLLPGDRLCKVGGIRRAGTIRLSPLS